MEAVKQKLASLKLEENTLSDKLAELNSSIRTAKEHNDSLQYQIQGLVSSEKLLKLKIESEESRLSAIKSKLISQERMLSSAGENAHKLNTEDPHEEVLELELANKREELRSLSAQYEEINIHTQQVQAEQKRKAEMATALERNVAKLESQHTQIKKAWDKAESVNSPKILNTAEDDAIEKLEMKVKDFQQQLDAVTNTLEHSQREIIRLDRLIALCKDDLAEQRRANERIKAEFDGICSELQSI